RFEDLAETARNLGKQIVALKVGASEQAQAASFSHTASLAGSEAGANALFDRLGIARVSSLSALLETLRLLHVTGPLSSNRILCMSCSGGEASLVADTAIGHELVFPPLTEGQTARLRKVLGPHVALANPLDYQTDVWGDFARLKQCFLGAMDRGLGLLGIILDFPRLDRCDPAEWPLVVDAAAAARQEGGVPVALIASLPETLPEDIAKAAAQRGLATLSGLPDALTAIAQAAWLGKPRQTPPRLLLPCDEGTSRLLTEAEAKDTLATFGLSAPQARRCETPAEAVVAAEDLGGLVVLKGEGFAHKTEAGAVVLGLSSGEEVRAAAEAMGAPAFLVEEMVDGAVAELLLGVTRDPAHGVVLTLGAGGVLAEVLEDTVSLLLPVSRGDIAHVLGRLRISRLLEGYRGRAAANQPAIVDAVMALQGYVQAEANRIQEVEINPLICTPDRAVAADALIRLREEP
ncbi:MAG: acetate--CoA ligase family protein, partial [Pseudomonadota bacterium]